MATYKELQAQLAEITRQAEEARAAEVQAVIEDVRAKVSEYGLTEKDIFGRKRVGQQGKKTAAVAPKYRDPKTGAEWTGHGRAPSWIKDAKDRNRFLIAGTTAEAEVAVSKPATKKAATKKGAVAIEKAGGSNAKTAKKAAVKKAASKKAIAKKAARPAAKKTAAAKKGAGRKAAAAKNVVAETDVAAAPESDAV